MTPRFLAIVGPTCVGKTALAVALAKRLSPAELINADSRQLRSGTRVATFAPTPDELDGVRCHLLDLAPPGAPFSVAAWLHAARIVLADLDARHVWAILVGGSGLYVRALVDGFALAGVPPDPRMRAQRTARAATAEGMRKLGAELAARDPRGAQSLDLHNPRRVVRALEILDARPGPLGAGRRKGGIAEPVLVGLDVAPDTHREWVRHRVERMFRTGALAGEVAELLDGGVRQDDVAGGGIGYREALEVRAGITDMETAIEATVRRTLRYAKAQRTWFRRDPRVRWMRSDSIARHRLVEDVMAILECSRSQPGDGRAVYNRRP